MPTAIGISNAKFYDNSTGEFIANCHVSRIILTDKITREKYEMLNLAKPPLSEKEQTAKMIKDLKSFERKERNHLAKINIRKEISGLERKLNNMKMKKKRN